MISFSILPRKISRGVLLTATAIYLFAGTFGAVAGGGDHSGGHDGMSGHDFGNHNSGDHNFGNRDQGMKPPSESHRDRGDDRNNFFRKPDDRRQDAEGRTKMRGKDNAAPTTAAPGSASNNTIHPIVTNNPGTTTTSAPPAPSSAGNNTIHPIVTNHPAQPPTNAPAGAGVLPPHDPVGNTRPTVGASNPAQPPANGPAGAGALPPHDPVGNTHPTVGSSPPTVVSVSNGVTTTQIQNGLGGVTVYSDKPGTITVTNGKESTTLTGGSVTLSGNVVGVGGGQGVEVGPRNSAGNTVVAIKPPAPAPAAPGHVTGGGPEGGFFGDLGSSIKDGVKAVGNGLEEGSAILGKGVTGNLGINPGFHPSPVPPATSTIQQQ
jgi:hypothetical protein